MMRARRRPVKAEAGLTMIELLVTVAIMGLAFAVIVGGLSTAILGSDLQRRQASADTVLRSAAESVRALEYKPCDEPGGAVYAVPDVSGFTSAITVSGFWLPDSNGDETKDRFVAECPASDTGVQLLTLTVTPDVRGTAQIVQIVKRRP